MLLEARRRIGFVRLTTRRHRRILAASGATLLVSAGLIGLIGFGQWRGRQAVRSDTTTVLAQTNQLLLRSLRSRRGTLTLLRDTLARQPSLTSAELRAMSASAVSHTRHLLGIGRVKPGDPPSWWAGPSTLSPQDAAQLNQRVLRHLRARDVWRVPSTVVISLRARMLLLMIEPIKARSSSAGALLGVFDLRPLLEDFFATNLSGRYLVQLRDDHTLLHQSPGWPQADEEDPSGMVNRTLAVDATRWTVRMRPGSIQVARTISWFNAVFAILTIVAGVGLTGIIWILAARTWILQRAVDRRTAALRRASERLRRMAITDELTGLYNRRFFLSRWDWECERARRYRRPLACLMVDVNDFKQVNDRLGHRAGDDLLRAVAKELRAALRQSDILARLGGDEFVIALPETAPAQAESAAAKLRHIRLKVPELPPVRLSVGLGQIEADRGRPEDVLEAADRSLYADKRLAKAVAAPHA